jgi:hypothetical protein
VFSQSVSGVPLDIQLIMIPKILSYDKSFSSNTKVGVGIIYNSSLRSSEQIKNDIMKISSANKFSVKGNDIIYIPIDISKKQSISDQIKRDNIKALYITPLRSFNLSFLLDECKIEKITSFTDVPEFVGYGVVVFFDFQNNRPKITINLKPAEVIGIDFEPALLNIAKVIK